MRPSFYIFSLIVCLAGIRVQHNVPVGILPRATDTIISKIRGLSFASVDDRGLKTTYCLRDIDLMIDRNQAALMHMGRTNGGHNISAWYFPGRSSQRALVIGGVHGSELSSIEVAYALVSKLLEADVAPYYSVIIIPSLFPDNAALALGHPEETGSTSNIGRYTHSTAVDPNRQMPSPGKSFNEEEQKDHLNRPIEKENQLLMQLIQSFKPTRIANLHAIRNTGYGGVYADPRTDSKGLALGYASDSSLALEIASFIDRQGGNVAGNFLDKKPTALYYKDPTPAAVGIFQKRNMTGSSLQANRGSGVSLGTWGTTAISGEQDDNKNRDAMRVITMEFPGSKRPADYKSETLQSFFRQQIRIFAESLRVVFLESFFTEEITSAKYNRI